MLQHMSTRAGLIVALVTAAIVAACGAGIESRGGAPAGTTISFAAPENGATVSIPFDVTLDASVPLGEPETGNHHAHLYFDSSTNASDYDIVYGNTWQVTRDLAPGEHTITVALANPNHSLAGPMQQITVTVGENGAPAGGSGDPGGATTAPQSSPLDY